MTPSDAIPPRRWPSGDYWVIGILSHTTSELSLEAGLQFASGVDGLGEYQLAVVQDREAGQIWLMGHLDSPEPGTEVRVDLNVSQEAGLNGLWRHTGLDKRAFKWLNPYSRHPWSEEQTERHWALTAREMQVVALLEDDTDKIAKELRIAPSTVSGHLQRIYLKLGVHSRAELRELLRRQPNIARSA